MSFKAAIKSNKFIVTTEICPPKGVEVKPILEKASLLRGIVDAVNVTDNQRAKMNLSSLAFSRLLVEAGFDPIFQMTCRDKNALALQSDILGAYALGIRNILAISGDYPVGGKVRPVYDFDSVQLISTIKKMERDGEDTFGDKLLGSPEFMVGGAVNPGAEPLEPQIIKMKKKLEAGCDFFQTQVIYDIEVFKKFLKEANCPKTKIIAGIFPLKNYKLATFLNEKVPGVRVPKDILSRMEKANDPEKEGLSIAAEMIKELKPICAGVHIMTLNNLEMVSALVSMTNLK